MHKLVITIGRQYGSGGREIGVRVAELLGIRSFDRELIKLAEGESGLAEAVVNNADERAASSFTYTLSGGATSHGMGYDSPVTDKIFIAQSNVIKMLAEETDCVIIGRCADYVLRDHKKLINIFVYGDIKDRVDRVMKRNGISEGEARDLIKKTDKRRASYYNFYTGKKWGGYDHYDFIVNSSKLGIEGTAQVIAEIAKKFKKQS